MTTRLIERWLPIAALGIESVRERTPMTPFPAPNRLHVWWARRPLVASRAAVLASLLPPDADRERFMQMLGVHGDPVAAQRLLQKARRTGVRVADPYGYTRAFKYLPTSEERRWYVEQAETLGIKTPRVLDPTAGGGSIPFEAHRLGAEVLANDLNPVAALILFATLDWPSRFATDMLDELKRISQEWRKRVEPRIRPLFPSLGSSDVQDTTYLWARTIRCPYCEGLIPLSPNWRLSPNGTGVRLLPDTQAQRCSFEVVSKTSEHSDGTVAQGDARCPYPNCARVVDGDEVKRQAQAGEMGEQLYTVVFRRRVTARTKTGREREKWERGFRAPRSEDDNADALRRCAASKMPEWEANDVVPTEAIPEGNKTEEPQRYGALRWRDLFSPRQLICHVTSVEVFRELLAEEEGKATLDDTSRAAFGYLCISLDKMLNYNSRMSVWMPTREVVANTFNRHDFAFCWSHAEMSPLIAGLGYDWAIEETGKCIEELIELARPDLHLKRSKKRGQNGNLFTTDFKPPPITITCKPGDSLDHVTDGSIDVVVMDPPYYDNVMYAELSDFFYVWLKRTAGYVYPELFRRQLTDKDSEAVANPARYRGQKGAKARAARDYQERMAAIFAECQRVLKSDGVLTLMFTHKATGAWDALTSGLMRAGFTITASWPINTEAEGSLHIKDKAAANSTIFLVCRPRPVRAADQTVYWEDVEPRVAEAVRMRIAEFEDAGIRGVDLYLACFGPALEEFARHWPLQRGTPKPDAKQRRGQLDFFEPKPDPYAVTPEDALDAARREVKAYRLDKLLQARRREEMDRLTEWFVLAWDAFRAPVFPYDEALRLARVVGIDLDGDVVRQLAEKKGSDIVLWDSAKRAAKGALGAPDGSRGMVDALHHAAHRARAQSVEGARQLLEEVGVLRDPAFAMALKGVLEVLPVSSAFTGVEDDETPLGESARDFDALERLRRLAFAETVPVPQQLEMWSREAGQT